MITLARILRAFWELIVVLYGLAMMLVCMVGVPAAMLYGAHLVVPTLWHWIGELGLWWPHAQLVIILAIAWWCGLGLTMMATGLVPGAVRRQGHRVPVNQERAQAAQRFHDHEIDRAGAETPPGPPDPPRTRSARVG